jgi:putative pyruvate formate lyase activating enzyme
MGNVETSNLEPGYVALLHSGELERRVERARAHLTDCVLCGRQCRVNRIESVRGASCRTGERAVVHGHGAHHGEEDPLRGTNGSGTIFFSSCNLRCVYCQNWEISQKGEGNEATADELATMMLSLQERGCHNVNFVSPSHVVAQLLEAILHASRRGLRLPLVFNSGGYDSLVSLELLDGVFDIYMPDMKYGDSKTARDYSKVKNYVATNRAAVKEMHRQVGDLTLDDQGVAVHGLLVRHLVLPGGLANSGAVFKFISGEISKDTYVNVIDQYRPAHLGWQHPPLDRTLQVGEYEQALALAAKHGLRRLDRHDTRWC